MTGQPLVTETTKTLTQSGSALPLSGQVGKKFGYGAAPFYWLASETDKLDGRTTQYPVGRAVWAFARRTWGLGLLLQTDWRWTESGAEPSPVEIPRNREIYREFRPFLRPDRDGGGQIS
jgi:hypothetical protein